MADNAGSSLRRAGVGQSVRRHEDARLLTGQGRFGDDLSLPGQAVAWVLRSPHAHAEIAAIETAAAAAAPGIVAVLTAAEYLADGNRAMPHAPAARSPPDIALANTDGSSIAVPDQMPLAVDRVRFVGEAVALVVAETLDAARDAAELVVVDYRPLPAVTAALAAAASDAQPLWDRPNITIDAWVGDGPATDAAFAGPPMSSGSKPRAAGHRRADGAARRDRRIRRRRRAATRSMRAPAARAPAARRSRSVLGVAAEQVRVVCRRCRRQFRHPQRHLSRNSRWSLGGEAGRPAGQMALRPQRSVPQRLSGPRPDRHGRAGARRATAISWRCALQPQQSRRLCAPRSCR